MAMTVDPFGFNLAKLKPANKETAKHNITEPKTSFDELKNKTKIGITAKSANNINIK